MSKFIMYDWRCQSCNHKFDDLAKPDVKTLPCPKCGAEAKRLISAGTRPFSDGKDPSMPTDYDRWERVNKAKIKEDKKFHENHGVDKKHHSYGS